MKKVIITGATSMIGVALVNKLLLENIYVIAIVRPHSIKTKYLKSHSNLLIIESEIEDLSLISEKFKDQYDALFHLAWESAGSNREKNIFSQIDNIKMTLRVLDFSVKIGVKLFIGVGSQAEYGLNKDGHIITEEQETLPDSIYGLAKLSAFKFSELFLRDKSTRIKWVRVFSVFGYLDREDSLVMSSIYKAIKDKDIYIHNCYQMWEYLFVENAVNALFKILSSESSTVIYNLTSSDRRSLKSYIEAIIRLTNSKSKLICQKGNSEENYHNFNTQNSLVSREFGHFEDINFEDGIEKMINIIKNK